MNKLKPKIELISEGLLNYEHGSRSYSILRLKARFMEYFEMLKVRDKRFSYKLEVYGYNYESFKQRISEIERQGRMLPIILSFYEVSENEERKLKNN